MNHNLTWGEFVSLVNKKLELQGVNKDVEIQYIDISQGFGFLSGEDIIVEASGNSLRIS